MNQTKYNDEKIMSILTQWMAFSIKVIDMPTVITEHPEKRELIKEAAGLMAYLLDSIETDDETREVLAKFGLKAKDID